MLRGRRHRAGIVPRGYDDTCLAICRVVSAMAAEVSGKQDKNGIAPTAPADGVLLVSNKFRFLCTKKYLLE